MLLTDAIKAAQGNDKTGKKPTPGKKGPMDLPAADDAVQEQYDNFVAAGLKVISAMTDDLMAIVQSSSPAEGLATAALTVVSAVQERSGPVPSDALFQAGIEIMRHVAEFAVKSGLWEENTAELNKAAQIVVTELLEEFGDEKDVAAMINMVSEVDPETAEQIGAEQSSYAEA